MKKVLFISHDASLTGAPILLLRLIKGLQATNMFEIFILLRSGGKLENDFASYGKTFIWQKKQSETTLNKLMRRVKLHSYTNEARRKKYILNQVSDIDIIFNNTVTNAELLKEIPLSGKRVFSYFHELELVIARQTKQADVEFLATISETIFVPSVFARRFFEMHYKIANTKLQLLKYIIPETLIVPGTNSLDKNDKFYVGFCGTLYWRKGYDLVPLLVHKVIQSCKTNDIHFIWIGANRNSLEYLVLTSDLRKLGVMQYFTIIEPEEDIANHLQALDVFVLPSREDTFPLVVLEAAALAVPSICFNKAGGIPEFVENDAGVCVDYLDIESMAAAILKLKNDPALTKALGQKAREKLLPYTNHQQIVSELIQHFD